MAALNSAAIHRLKRTWEQLPPTVLRQFRGLDELTRPSRSHAALRAAMREGFDQPTVRLPRALPDPNSNPGPNPGPNPDPNPNPYSNPILTPTPTLALTRCPTSGST